MISKRFSDKKNFRCMPKFLFGMLIFIAIKSILVYLIWNWLMIDLFNLKDINILQSFLIVILSKLLFSSFHGRCHERFPHYVHDKKCCRIKHSKQFHRFWNEIGKDAYKEYLRNQENNTDEKKDEK